MFNWHCYIYGIDYCAGLCVMWGQCSKMCSLATTFMKRTNQKNSSTTVVILENKPGGVSRRVVHKEDSLGGQKVTCFVSGRPALHSCRQLTITDHYSTKTKLKQQRNTLFSLIRLIENKQPATFRLTFGPTLSDY